MSNGQMSIRVICKISVIFTVFQFHKITSVAQIKQLPLLDTLIKQEQVNTFRNMNNYLLENKGDSALHVCNEYRKLIQGNQDSARNFYYSYMLFVLYNSLRNEDSLNSYKNKLLQYATNYSNYSMRGFAQLTVGKLLVNQEKPIDAIPFIEKAIQEFEKYPVGSGLIESVITLSKCYGNQGNRKMQLTCLNKALDLLKKSPPSKDNIRNEIAINLSMARTYNILKYNEKANEYAMKAYLLTKASPDHKSFISDCIEMISYIPGLSKQQKIEYLKEGLDFEMRTTKKDYLKRFAYNLAYNYGQLNQLDSGKYYYTIGKQSSYQTNNKTQLAAEKNALFIASLYYQLDTSLALISDYERSGFQPKDSNTYKREIALRKKNYYLITKQYDSFTHYQSLYEEYDKIISGTEKTEITERLNIEFETERKAKEIELLSKANEVKQLELTNNKINLARYELENLKQRQRLLINNLEISNKNKTLEISKAERDRKTQELLLVNKDIKEKETQLVLLEQSKQNDALLAQKQFIQQENEQVKEKRNIWIGFLCSAALIGLAVVYYIQKNNQRNQRLSYEAMIKSIEQERDRISSDLHDDIGSTLSSIAIYNELISDKVKTKPELVPQLSEKISVQINELMHHTEDIIWSLKIGPHQNEKISKRVQEYATELLDSKQIQSHIDIESNAEQLLQQPEQRRNMLLIIKEAMNNCTKYSKANNFIVKMYIKANVVVLDLLDDGIGFSQDTIVFGDGIQNIQKRCKNLNGHCEIKSEVGQGTSIHCEIPISSYL